jgi:hypothetical protein
MAFQPRVSIRYIMAIVLFIAVILALAIPAVEVYRTKEYHTHTKVVSNHPDGLTGSMTRS